MEYIFQVNKFNISLSQIIVQFTNSHSSVKRYDQSKHSVTEIQLVYHVFPVGIIFPIRIYARLDIRRRVLQKFVEIVRTHLGPTLNVNVKIGRHAHNELMVKYLDVHLENHLYRLKFENVNKVQLNEFSQNNSSNHVSNKIPP